MDLHLQKPCGQLQLRDITLTFCIQSSEGIHDVKVLASVIQMILFIFDDLETVQDVCEQPIERGIFLLLFLKTDSQIITDTINLRLVVSKTVRACIKLEQTLIFYLETRWNKV